MALSLASPGARARREPVDTRVLALARRSGRHCGESPELPPRRPSRSYPHFYPSSTQ